MAVRKPSAGSVRIVAGKWKRTRIPVLDLPGLRPTPDRVRETVFNWINHAFDSHYDGRTAIDLFAGSGALGFEAASRGATRVVLVEKHPAALAGLRALQTKLQAAEVEIIGGEAAAIARNLTERGDRFDAVFLDPPFGAGLMPAAIALAAALCTPAGVVYAEAEAPIPADQLAATGLSVWRSDRAGDVFYHLLRRKNNE